MTPSAKIMRGNCIERMRELEENSIDAIVTDGPYALEFMGSSWDSPSKMLSQATGISGGFQKIDKGVHRPDVSKHNPHLFQRWTQAWAEEALRILRPGGHMLAFGSTRTHHRHACGIEDAAFEIRDTLSWNYLNGFVKTKLTLKPGYEPITLARKPCEGTQRDNIAKHGVGGLFIDACRIPVADTQYQAKFDSVAGNQNMRTGGVLGDDLRPRSETSSAHPGGRHPMNVLADFDMAQAMSAHQSRMLFFTKPSSAEKSAGLDAKNSHKTIKPIDLMRYLVRLVTPPGGLVLDPFLGSGSTGCAAMLEGFDFIGIELEAEYVEIAAARIKHWKNEAEMATA